MPSGGRCRAFGRLCLDERHSGEPKRKWEDDLGDPKTQDVGSCQRLSHGYDFLRERWLLSPFDLASRRAKKHLYSQLKSQEAACLLRWKTMRTLGMKMMVVLSGELDPFQTHQHSLKSFEFLVMETPRPLHLKKKASLGLSFAFPRSRRRGVRVPSYRGEGVG